MKTVNNNPRVRATRRRRTMISRSSQFAVESLEQRQLMALIGVTLGFPALNYGTNVGLDPAPQLRYNNGTLAFDGNGTPLSMRFSSGGAQVQVSGAANASDRDFRFNMRIDNSGTLLGGVAGDDLSIRGSVTDPVTAINYSGQLLTGEIQAYGSQNGGSGTTDNFDFVFVPTGGLLLPFYAGQKIGMTLLSINSSFSGSFATSFTGQVNGSVGPTTPVKIGNFVWNDVNANGIQDPTELGIPGVSVTLSGTDSFGNTVVDTAVTDSAGKYQFVELPGTYSVAIDSANYLATGALDGYTPSPTLQGGNTALDSNPTPSDTTPAAMPINSVDTSIDFGFYKPVTIGNFVWNDLNANGAQDANEPGIPNVKLTLSGTNLAGQPVTDSVITDAFGAYQFTEAPGTYTVSVDGSSASLAGFAPTIANAPGTNFGNDSFTGSGSTTLSSGTSDPTLDFGFFLPVIIGNYVWNDADGDGIQDGSENGIEGVTLLLSGTSGAGAAVFETATTDADGLYQFTGLEPGTYSIAVDASTVTGWIPTITGQGTAATDSNFNPSGTTPSALSSGESDQTIDFGFYKPSSISGFVYHDLNNDGIKQASEPGIPNVAVSLGGTVSQSTFTDSDGAYSFIDLPIGTYTVTEPTQPAAYLDGKDAKEGSVIANSSGGPDSISTITLGANSASTDNNFGEIKAGSIGDYFFLDRNANGIQDAGDVGLDGITVHLLSSTGAVLDTTTTASGGYYLFSNLTPDSYRVEFVAPGYSFTSTDQGVNDALDSDADASGKTALFALASAQNDTSRDSGVLPIDLSLAKTVHNPTPQIGSTVTFTITLSNAAGLSDAAGVKVTDLLPAGLSFISAAPAQGSYGAGVWNVGTLASGASTTLTLTALVTSGALTSATNTAEVTAANLPDRDSTPNNHIASEDDQDSATVTPQRIDLSVTKTVSNASPAVGSNIVYTITLSNAAGLDTATGVTLVDLLPGGMSFVSSSPSVGSYNSATGAWTVGSLAAGASATLQITATVTTGGTKLNIAEVTAADQYDIDSTPNNHIASEDDQASASLTPPGSIGDRVFLDSNANGIQDGSEPGIDGVIVNLLNSSGGLITSTTTSGGGLYIFGNLAPGSYQVEFLVPSGHVITAADKGSNDALDSDASTSTGRSPLINLTSGQSNSTIDAGLYKLASLSGYVYVDANNDGIKQSGEAGISGAAVTLTGVDGLGNPVNIPASTNASGLYQFQNLIPGTYTITESQPASYLDGKDSIGTPGGTAANDLFSNIILASGINGANNNFGEILTSTICGTKFLDKTGNGLTADDSALCGVTIKLYADSNNNGSWDSTDAVVGTTMTGTDGKYTFSVAPGTYFVKEVVATNYVRTAPTLSDNYKIIAEGGKIYGKNDFANFFKDCCCDDIVNVSYKINGSTTVSDLRGNTNQGDFVEVKFTVLPGQTLRLTLVSYTAPSAVWDANLAYQQKIFQQASGIFTAGTYTLSVQIPNCFYQVDFVCGYAIDQFGPAGSNITYSSQCRLISADNDGRACAPTGFGSLSGFVYLDKDNDGKFETGESGIACVTIKLTGTDNTGASITLTRVTDSKGFYSFDGLRPGTYSIKEVQPTGYLDGKETLGTAGGICGADIFSQIFVVNGTDGDFYNFAERPK